MTLFAMAVPIPQGNEAKWKDFVNDLNGSRKAEYRANRKKLGVRERTFLQQTPMGDFVVVTLEGNDPTSAITKFAEGNDDFTRWFKSKVQEVHGMDLSGPMPFPLPTLVIDSGE